jgi:hypothetical protein
MHANSCRLIIPAFGAAKSIPFCLAVYAVSQFLIAAAPAGNSVASTACVYAGLALTATGSVAFPATLAYLNDQVRDC